MRGPFFAAILAFAATVATLLSLPSSSTAAPAAEALRSAVTAPRPSQPLHIVFVHGIRTDGRGASLAFQSALCGYFKGCTGRVFRSTSVLDLGEPPNATWVGGLIWDSAKAWEMSRPFVDHYRYERSGAFDIIVDEVNWWPLAFPLKCRLLLGRETSMIGPNNRTIQLCAAVTDPHSSDWPPMADHFAWFTPNQAASLMHLQPRGGSTAVLNRWAKAEILDWGFSDAVLSLGTMRPYTHETIRCALMTIAAFDPAAPAEQLIVRPDKPLKAAVPQAAFQQMVTCKNSRPPRGQDNFVIVSHSLGSFLLLDTFASAASQMHDESARVGAGASAETGGQALCVPESAAGVRLARSSVATELQSQYAGFCAILRETNNLYFMANQFPLLELARIEGINPGLGYSDRPRSDAAPSPKPADTPGQRLRDALGEWARIRSSDKPKSVVAFSDPNDLLTFYLPCIAGAQIYNVPVHNDTAWFHVLERPDTAHTGYFLNKKVLDPMFNGLTDDAKAKDTCEVDSIPK